MKPPNGVATRTDVFVLIDSTPVSTARDTRTARPRSRVQIEPDRPYSGSLASLTASAYALDEGWLTAGYTDPNGRMTDFGGKKFGDLKNPLLVSVRSGANVVPLQLLGRSLAKAWSDMNANAGFGDLGFSGNLGGLAAITGDHPDIEPGCLQPPDRVGR